MSHIKNYIKRDFREYLDLNRSTMPDGLYCALIKNERLPVFFENLEQAFYILQMRNRVKLNRLKIKSIVYDMTKMFVSNVKKFADENSLSILERMRIIDEQHKKLPVSDEEAEEIKKHLTFDGVIDGK